MNHTEQTVWKELQEVNRTLPTGVYWQRQMILCGFIVDFACSAARLIIEVNGESHRGKEEYDLRRQWLLEHNGWKVLNLSGEVFDPNTLYAFMKAVKAQTIFRLNKYNR